jgi:hypothetical protein
MRSGLWLARIDSPIVLIRDLQGRAYSFADDHVATGLGATQSGS